MQSRQARGRPERCEPHLFLVVASRVSFFRALLLPPHKVVLLQLSAEIPFTVCDFLACESPFPAPARRAHVPLVTDPVLSDGFVVHFLTDAPPVRRPLQDSRVHIHSTIGSPCSVSFFTICANAKPCWYHHLPQSCAHAFPAFLVATWMVCATGASTSGGSTGGVKDNVPLAREGFSHALGGTCRLMEWTDPRFCHRKELTLHHIISACDAQKFPSHPLHVLSDVDEHERYSFAIQLIQRSPLFAPTLRAKKQCPCWTSHSIT